MSEETNLSSLVEPKLDIHLMRTLLKIIKEHREELEWLLQRHNQLRMEYITFFKIDRTEIVATLKNQEQSEERINQILQEVSKLFRSDIEKSFALVDVRFQEMSQK